MFTIDSLNYSKFNRDYLYELKKGEVTVVHASVLDLWGSTKDTFNNIAEWYRFLRENNDLCTLVKTGEDFKRAEKEGKIGIILGIQNTSPLEDNLSLVEAFNNLGLKIMQLTYNNQNLIGSGCYEEIDNGISRFGKNVIKEMNRVGMVIDLSHCGPRTTIDAIKTSTRPVAVTHANPEWIFPSVRNKNKEELGTLRDHNGMLGLVLFPNMMRGTNTTLEEFADLAAETADFMGPEKLGIGSDLINNLKDLNWVRMGRWTHEIDYGSGKKDDPAKPEFPSWFQSPADFPVLAEALTKRGFSEKEVKGIMGENWLNFFEKAFKSEETEKFSPA